MKTITVLL